MSRRGTKQRAAPSRGSVDAATRWQHPADGSVRASWDTPNGLVEAVLTTEGMLGEIRLLVSREGRVTHDARFTSLSAAMREAERLAKAAADPLVSVVQELVDGLATVAVAIGRLERDVKGLAFMHFEREEAEAKARQSLEVEPLVLALSLVARRDLLDAVAAWMGVEVNDVVLARLVPALVELGERVLLGSVTDADRAMLDTAVRAVRPEMEACGLFDPQPGEYERPEAYAPLQGVEARLLAMDVWMSRVDACLHVSERRASSLRAERALAETIRAAMLEDPQGLGMSEALARAQFVVGLGDWRSRALAASRQSDNAHGDDAREATEEDEAGSEDTSTRWLVLPDASLFATYGEGASAVKATLWGADPLETRPAVLSMSRGGVELHRSEHASTLAAMDEAERVGQALLGGSG